MLIKISLMGKKEKCLHACSLLLLKKCNYSRYFLHNDISDTLVRVVADEKTTKQQLELCLMLWTMLSNYNRFEVRNAYTTKLSRCREKSVLEVSSC